jgi:hydrocephalus-inducing protein
LSVSASVAGEDGMYSCVLPEDLLVEILAERMQVQYAIFIRGIQALTMPAYWPLGFTGTCPPSSHPSCFLINESV